MANALATRARVLRALCGGPTRLPDLAKHLELPPATIAAAVKELSDEGIVSIADYLPTHPSPTRGRRGKICAIQRDRFGWFLGISLAGRTTQHLFISLIDAGGARLELGERLEGLRTVVAGEVGRIFDVKARPRENTFALGELVRKLVFALSEVESPHDPGQKISIDGVGVCLEGHVQDGKLISSPTFPLADAQLDLVEVIRGPSGDQLPDTPTIVIENDLRALALADYATDEFRIFPSAESGPRTLPERDEFALLVKVGAGVGAAIMHDGELINRRTQKAAEIGHAIVEPLGDRPQDRESVPWWMKPLPCDCGKCGCLESIVGETNVLRRYLEDGGHAERVRDIADADPERFRALATYAGALVGRRLADLTNIFDFNRITVLVGELDTDDDDFITSMKKVHQDEAYDLRSGLFGGTSRMDVDVSTIPFHEPMVANAAALVALDGHLRSLTKFKD